MLVFAPLFLALLIGGAVLMLTRWIRKTDVPLYVKMLPGVVTVAASVFLFLFGIVKVRGFEGGAYFILAFFLIEFGIASLIMVRRKQEGM